MSDAINMLPDLSTLSQLSICILSGVAASLWVLGLGCLLPDRSIAPVDGFDSDRIAKLSNANPLFRHCNPMVHFLIRSGVSRATDSDSLAIESSPELAAAGVAWKPDEYLATKMIEGAIVGSIFGFFGIAYAPLAIFVTVPLAALIFSVLIPRLAITSLAAGRNSYLLKIKSRLPFALDLIALMMQASGTFTDALRTVVHEERNHPLGKEFGLILRDIELGGSRADAFRGFLRRWDDPDLQELVTAILRGEELGTPIAGIFAEMSEQFRLKRSQWIEKAAAQAQVKMVYPGFIVLFGCLALVLAPFAIRFSEAF
ncbi:type II secretion system F family protein [Rubripirellula amarantea]|nr:type II secretion system F family protein [Rubripirellula amarantea]